MTNVGPEQLNWKAVVTLYRARWQVEVLFKLWKSHNALERHPSDRDAWWPLAWFFARLLGAVLQHWLLLGMVWQLHERSLVKAATELREWMKIILVTLDEPQEMRRSLKRLQSRLLEVATVKGRKKNPSHARLMEDEEWLEWVS